ncbi:transmembrane protein 70, mitochondrial [Solea solea]|uniref:transmembrane protein 70, mitochondrial n=1 Tax=Solea solea TaxID=90069 RepID=UPI00272AA906|nr:transmembrane protein 70, mitochondrial [Solea solea]
MFSVTVLCRLRPRIVSSSFRYIHATAVCPGFFVGGVSRGQLHASRSSFVSLNSNSKLQSYRPSTRFTSTSTHSEDGHLIYTGGLTNAIRGVRMFSYSTSCTSLFLMPYLVSKKLVGTDNFALQVAFGCAIGFFTFVTPVFLHLMTHGYVMRLYHNPDKDTYTAITFSVFLTEKRNTFHQSQVKIPAVSQMFTTLYAGTKGLMVNPDLFAIPHDYNHLMGYDKPFSFDLDDVDRPDKS